MRMQVSALCAILLFVVPNAVIATSPDGTPSGELPIGVPAVKEISAGRFAVLEHTGPYWTIGTTLRRVHQQRLSSIEPIEILARYASNPLSARSDTLRAEVGFRLSEGAVAPEGFHVVDREAERVAYLAFDSDQGPRAQHYTELRQWVVYNGYRGVGPVTEVFTVPSDETASVPRVELQMAIRSVQDSRPEREPTGGRTTADATHRSEETPDRSVSTKPDQQTPSMNVVGDDIGATPATHLVIVVEPSVATHPAFDIEEPVELPEAEDGPSVGAVSGSATEPKESDVQPAGDPEQNHGPCSDFAADFVRRAAPLSPDTQIWIGEVLLRVDAISRTLRKVAPPTYPLVECSSVLFRDYQIFTFGQQAPVFEARRESGTPNRTILRELDGLMVRLATKRVVTDLAEQELAALFERIGTILDAERAALSESRAVP